MDRGERGRFRSPHCIEELQIGALSGDSAPAVANCQPVARGVFLGVVPQNGVFCGYRAAHEAADWPRGSWHAACNRREIPYERPLVTSVRRLAKTQEHSMIQTMSHRQIFITDLDRRRLGTLISDPAQFDLLDRRYIQDLEQELDRAETVDAAEIPSDVVTMNSTVRLTDLDAGDTATYTLVYPDAADVKRDRISVLAPVGTAILGYRVGDTIRWPVPNGEVRLKVEAVLYQPEREGDFRR
jgi:regulator of nucleoside diphosphate kinase